MISLTIQSPAKVNLFLRVLKQRPDGYHELETLFHRVSLCDRLVLKKITSKHTLFRLTTNHPRLSNTSQNLIYHAYQLLRKYVSWKGSVHVRLTKRIPLASGLGGGSSNAAHFLLGMNRLFNLRLSQAELCRLGAQLGSDVPFFIYQVNQALGKGRGERIEPMPFKGRLWFVIVIPPFGVSTKKAYQFFSQKKAQLPRPRLTRISRSGTITSEILKCLKWGKSPSFFQNDLFSVSCLVQPELDKLRMFFDEWGIKVTMSGSGSALFSVYGTEEMAQTVAREIRKHRANLGVFVSCTY